MNIKNGFLRRNNISRKTAKKTTRNTSRISRRRLKGGDSKINEELEELKKIKEEKDVKNIKNEYEDFYFTKISNIEINIQSNIPNNPPFILKRSNFITKFQRPKTVEPLKDYSELPYFTDEVEYPTKSLYKMEPYEIFDFFFSRSYFEYKLDYIIFKKNRGTKPPKKESAEIVNTNYTKKNIMTMLTLLFTTVYPRTNNVTNSMDEYIRKQTNPLNLNRITQTPNYTYMNIDGSEYTLVKIIWLNDILNHPKYKKLANEFINYKTWCISQSQNIKNKIDDNIQKIEKLIIDFNLSELLNIIIQKLDNIKNSKQKMYSYNFDLFQSNVEYLKKIIIIINLYKSFLISGKQNDTEFLNKANQFIEEFKPYDGQNVEIRLNDGYWYFGTIISENKNKDNFTVRIFYSNSKNELLSIKKSINIKDIREPILQKIIKNKNTNFTIEQVINIDNIDFSNAIENEKDEIKDEKEDKLEDKFVGQTIQVENISDIDYNNNPYFYRYKIKPGIKEKTAIINLKRSEDPNADDQVVSTQAIDVFLNYLDILEEIYNKIKTNINFNSNIKNFIEGIIRLYNIILPIKTINDLYLDKYSIDIQHKDIATKETATELTPYKNFTNFITNFLGPKMESSNTDLQSFIFSYAENISSTNFVTLMQLLETCYSDKKPICKIIKNKQKNEAVFKYIDTGINYINMNDDTKPQYEINIYANFVSGHLDNTNWRTIKCMYSDEYLTNKFTSLFNTKQLSGDWIISPEPFIDMKDAKKSEKPVAMKNNSSKKKNKTIKNEKSKMKNQK